MDAAAVESFIENGYVRVENAVPRAVVDDVLAALSGDLGCDLAAPATWTRPVVRLGDYAQPPFVASAGTPALRAAYDALAGAGRWLPRMSLGSFVVRFPHAEPPGDDGWHVDASFPGDAPHDYFSWRINVASRGRALTMLFLFSDVGEDDAPTRLRVGSHRDVARLLAPHGEAGLAFMDLAGRIGTAPERTTALATGPAGTVYLCHPFLAHAGQAHRGTTPRVLAQPALFPTALGPPDAASPVAAAIRLALATP